ncbi:MAG: hypothetical protein AAGF85_02250 [Bacteroidota bacterium]
MSLKIPANRSFEHEKLVQWYESFKNFINELRKRTLNDSTIEELNGAIDRLNNHKGDRHTFQVELRKTQTQLLKYLEKNEKIVVKNYYRKLWLVLGMTVYGIPVGLLFSLAIGNMAFIAIGLPIGMAVGIGVGTNMDKKAAREGRQLNIENWINNYTY